MNSKIKLIDSKFTDRVSHIIATEDSEQFERVLRSLAKEQKEKENIKQAKKQVKEIEKIIYSVNTNSQYDDLIDTFEFEEDD